MQKLTLNIKGMEDDKCEVKVVDKLKTLDGVLLVNVDYKTETGVITFSEDKVKPEDIAEAIRSLGYTATPSDTAGAKRKPDIFKLILGWWILLALITIALEMYPPSRDYIASRINPTSKLEVLQDSESEDATPEPTTSVQP